MAEYVVAQAAVLIVPSLGKGPNNFHQKLEAQLKAQQHDVEVEVRAQTAKMVAQIKAAKAWADGQEIQLKVNELGITKSITEIRYKYENLQRQMKKALILDLKITGMTLLPQLAAGLAAANASMVQLAQSAALLPGVLSGVLSSFGALAVGLTGIKAAFKEYGDAQKNAAQEGLKARNAALNVNNAYRDLNSTLKDAKRSLEDLNAQLRDAPLDEADAIIQLQEARAEAAEKYQKSGLQQQKDALAVLKAENQLADTRLRNSRLLEDVATANAKGVAGNAAVVDATDRLSKAMDDASTKSTKLTDSLSALSPKGQEFIKSVKSMSGEWTAFRDSVQDRLFDGLGQEVVQLGQNYLPILQQGLGGISAEINGNLKTAMGVLQTDTNKGFFERIFGNTADAQGALNNAINPLIDALLRLSAAGSDFLPRLADGLTDVLTRFDNFIVRAEGDGSLEKWMNTGIDALKDLGNSIINIGSMLSSLNDAFTGAGGNSLLGSLEQATSRLAEMMRSADGQNKLIRFFTDAREQLAQWRPLLDAIPGVLVGLGNAAESVADILLPFLTGAAQTLRTFPGLVEGVFYAFVLWKNIIPVVKGVHGMVGTLVGGLDTLKTKLNDHSGAQGHIGKYVTTMGNAKTMVGELAKSLGPTVLLTAVTTAATYLGTRLAKAHIDAKEEARRHKEELDQLVDSLDDVTGAAGRATNAVIGENLRNAANTATGQNFGNLTGLLTDPTGAIEAVKRGDLEAALGYIKGGAITAGDVTAVDSGNFWRDKGQSLIDFGLTAQDVADALNGNQEKAKKYQQWQDEGRRITGLSSEASKAILDVFPSRAAARDAPSLKDLQGKLPNDGNLRAATAGILSENARNITEGGAAQRTANEQDFGKVRLPAGSPLAQFGVLDPPALNADGGAMITSSKPVDGSALAEQLRNEGVTFEDFDEGKFKVQFNREAANQYLERYASGGLISGPGTGTSDSILARLSRGEYVVNAASTAKNLPLLESINGGALPAFAPGGPVVPDIAPPSNSSDQPAAPSPQPTLLRPGDGLLGSGMPILTNFGLLSDIGNFFKAATGLGETPEGYKETSTATVSTDNGIMTKPTPVTMGGLDVWTTEGSMPNAAPAGSFGSFLQDVAGNVAGSTPVKPFTPVAPSDSPVAPSKSPVSGPAGESPLGPAFGPAPAGKTWDYLKGEWVTAAPKPFVYGAAMPSSSAGSDIFGPGKVNPSTALPAMLATPIAGKAIQAQIVEGVTSEVNFGAREAAKFGLSVSSGLRPGDSGFHGSGRAGDYSNQRQYGPPTAEMNAFATEVLSKYAPFIDELIYAGVPQNIHNGELVPAINMKNSPYNDAQAGYHGDHVHIAWKPGALEQIMAGGGGGILGGVAGSPSNMAMANTPAGLLLPQFTYTNGSSGDGTTGPLSGGSLMDQIKNISLQDLFNNYIKSVQENWGQIIQNLVKNAGGIAMRFIGDFFGLDLSGITNIANAVTGDVSNGIEGLFDTDGKDKSQGLEANSSLQDVLNSAEFNSLPAEYQQIYQGQVEAQGGEVSQPAQMLQQLLTLAQQQGAGSPAGYSPTGGAEQWRPAVRRALEQYGPRFGITNMQAWEDALVRQIQSESNGDPGADNPNDNNGLGGKQHVSGLLQFLPETFAANNITGGDYLDPQAQIAAAIAYVANKYGMDASGAPLQIGRGVGYARGGKIKGKGSGRSDSILARVSNGEYLVKASAAKNNLGLLNAINSGMPGFAEGMMWPVGAPAPVTPPTTPPPPPAPVPPAPMGPNAGAEAGQPVAPAPVTNNAGPGDPASTALQTVGDALSSVGGAVGGIAGGAEAPAGGSPTSDPRSVLGAAPQNLDHNAPAVSQGIQAAGAAISTAINTAMTAASMGATAASGGGGMGAMPASSMITGLVNAGTGAAQGAVNVLSSLMVGTLSGGGSTGGAYGTPLLPQSGQQNYGGPAVVNNWNGGVHTTNNDEFYKIQQRRELQNASPMLPRR